MEAMLSQIWRNLTAPDIAPGSPVTLLQRTPACIVRVDETLVSLDGVQSPGNGFVAV